MTFCDDMRECMQPEAIHSGSAGECGRRIPKHTGYEKLVKKTKDI